MSKNFRQPKNFRLLQQLQHPQQYAYAYRLFCYCRLKAHSHQVRLRTFMRIYADMEHVLKGQCVHTKLVYMRSKSNRTSTRAMHDRCRRTKTCSV